MKDEKGFLARCAEAREEIARMRNPLVVSHYDADGLASGALALKGIAALGIRGRSLVVKKLSARELSLLSGEEEIVFTDLGGGASREIGRALPGKKIVIIDHHQTPGGGPLQANPHLFGFDGGSELSAAGCGYFVFGNPSLVELGVVGAVGDMQFPLSGLNRRMLRDGEREGRVSVSTDLAVFGRVSRPLVWFLQYCTEPFIPGLSGRRAACARFLEELRIPLKTGGGSWRTYESLSRAEQVSLVSGLASFLLHGGGDWDSARSLVGEVYSFPLEERGSELSDAKEYSTVLNACGRHAHPEVGIGVCLGDAGAREQARELLALHRRQLRAAAEFSGERVEDFGPYRFIDARGAVDEGIIGVAAGMLYGSAVKREKPIIAIALGEGGSVKASARATKALVSRGLNLGKVMGGAAKGIGAGGGHNIAAGANISPGEGNVDSFLLKCGELVDAETAA
jgi:RecJ-like exonuclease